MIEYTIIFKNDDEEFFKSKREFKNRLKEELKNVSQAFSKTYKYNRSNNEYEELNCVLFI